MGTASQPTRADAVQWARQWIDRLDARLLLEHSADCTQNELIAEPKVILSESAWAEFQMLVQRRAAGEPLAYLIGTAGFYGDLLRVTPDVLVPRPETESLVDWALTLIKETPSPMVLDLGTGSGAIALTLARERPDAQVLAVDISAAALAVAQHNARELGRTRVAFEHGHWFDGWEVAHGWDLIVSNPPYIPAQDPHLTGDGVRFEPRLALTDEADGLSAYCDIVKGAAIRLNPGGWLVVEHGHDQAEAVAKLWRAAGLVQVSSRQDLSGNPRMTAGRQPDQDSRADTMAG